ncbi:hypothetical protein BH09VER1_BH09VER1_19680 [soil metagenome]
MSLKPLFLALVLTVATFSRLSAEGLGPQSVIIEPPAPSSYTDDRPAYAYFKKIEIAPRGSGYDVTFTMQGDIPSTFPKDRGLDINMGFDFAEIDPYKSVPTSRIPNFHEDLMVSFYRYVYSAKFEPYVGTVEYHKRKWDFKITNFIVRKDTISFSLRSPLFNLHPASLVVFRTNPMKATSPNSSSGSIGQETTPISPDLPAAK